MKDATLAPVLVPMGLAGGQGKTTIGMMVGRIVASYRIPVLLVDADPQASMTAFLGLRPGADSPTLLEVITQQERTVPLQSTIVPVPGEENLFAIAADDNLESANHYLAASGMSLTVLRNRLYQTKENLPLERQVAAQFGLIVVDPPPERSHLALTALGAASAWVIPAEANVKGAQSLLRTKDLIEAYRDMVPEAKLLGVVPFRARWVGRNPTETTRESIDVMRQIIGEELLLPHVLESDVYKRAINKRTLPAKLGDPELQYPLMAIIDRLRPQMPQQFQSLLPKPVEP